MNDTISLAEPASELNGHVSRPGTHDVERPNAADDNVTCRLVRSKLDEDVGTSFPTLPSANYQLRGNSRVASDFEFGPLSPFPSSTVVRIAWAILLARYTDNDDVVFETSDSNSSAREKISGDNNELPVPLWVRVNDEQSIDQFMRDFEQHFQVAIDEKRSEKKEVGNGHKRSSSGLTDGPLNAIFFNEFGSQTKVPRNKRMKHALVLNCNITGGNLHVTAFFDDNVIDRRQTGRMLNQLVHIIRQLLNHAPGQKLKQIDMMSPQDKNEIQEWNTVASNAVDACVHHLFEQQAQKSPNATAVHAHDGDFTYQELDDGSSRLAHHLGRLGVGNNAFVAVCFEKSKWAVVAMMAVLKAGAAIVPLDHSHPVLRMKSILETCGANLVLCSLSQRATLEQTESAVLTVDAASLDAIPSAASASPEPEPVSSSSAAFVFFTSGSTGIPKGIIISHMAYCTSAKSHSKALRLNDGSRVMQFAAYTYDVSVGEIFTTLLCGGCICVPSSHDRVNNLAAAIQQMGVNWMFLTPSVAGLLQPQDVPGLKTLVLGGEPATRQNFMTWANDVYLINSYGPAECSIWTHCNPGVSRDTPTGYIGKSFNGISWITDAADPNRLAPIGAVGELVIEGPVLATGYLNDRAKTDAAFIEAPAWHPGSSERKAPRLYRTGDLVRYDSHGAIIILGRRDTQVKLRGQRVELGEIEFHIQRSLPTAAEVAVDVIKHSSGNHSVLMAFICENPKNEIAQQQGDEILPAPRSLQEVYPEVGLRLSRFLPRHMIPSAFVPVAVMPLTTSGKINRKRLRDLATGFSLEQLITAHPTKEKTPPSSEMELKLQALWGEVLDIPTALIGAEDSFLRLGGDSLRAMKLVSAADEMGIRLSVEDVFKNPELSALAQRISSVPQSKMEGRIKPFALMKASWAVDDIKQMAAKLCRVDPMLIEDAFPATPLQEGLMALSTKHLGSYVSQQILKLSANVDIDRFRASWDSVVAQNPILRTRLVHTEVDGTIQIVLCKVAELQITKAAELESFLESDRRTPMDFGDSLSRYQLVNNESANEHHFVWTCHHALYDGWSLPMVFKHLRDEYGFGTSASYQPPQFQGFVRYLKQIDTAAQQEYWRAQFSGSSPSDLFSLSTAYEPCADKTLSLSVPILRRLRSEATMSTLIRGAWALVISCYTDSSDVIFGCVLNGRNAPVVGIDRMVAPTVATVPIRVKVNSADDVSQYLENLQKHSNEMIPYEQTGLQNIRLASPEARVATDFQTLLVVEQQQQQQQADMDGNDEFLQAEDISRNRLDFTRFPVTLVCSLGADDVAFDVKFDSSLIPAVQMQRVMNHFKHVFEALCRGDARLNIGDINRPSPEDLAEVIGWNGTLPDVVDSCIHDCIDQRATEYPNAVAVDSWDGQLTYDELRLQSSRLADYLTSRGVGPGTMMPLIFEKSVWAVIGMMGVLRAGAACVPLDPSYPRARLEPILARLKTRMLLTSPLHASDCTNLPQEVLVLEKSLLEQQAPTKTIADRAQPSDAAFVLHTSGSTGMPKAIVLEHKALCTSLHAHGAVECLGRDSRVVQFAAYTFDVSISDIFATLMYGGCICIPSEFQRLNDLAGFIRSKRVNQAGLTPAVANLLDPSEVPCLEYLKLGGESMTQDNVARWSTKVKLLNSYGQAECSVKSAYNAWLGPDSDPSTIGKPVGGALWIARRDDHRQLVPIGAIGELIVEGHILAREYLEDAQKTEEAFPSSPRWLQDAKGRRSDRIFKSGDLAKYNPDGSIRYIGRKDTQVKLRGQRLELGDVEHHLQQCIPASSLASEEVQLAVELITPLDGEPMLAAFLSRADELATREPGSSDVKERDQESQWLKLQVPAIKARLLSLLPSYMIPSAFVALQQMPLSTSGKIDRKKLQKLAAQMSVAEVLASSASSSQQVRPPETEMQRRLHALWSKTLNIPPESFGVEDSLFQLGGDSITAIKLVTAARLGGMLLSVHDIFKQPRLADMALAARAVQESDLAEILPFALIQGQSVLGVEYYLEEIAALCNVKKSGIDDVYPCTPLQEGLMALSLTDHGAYIAQLVFEMPATLDIDRFQRAWEAVFRHHAILRARMVRTNELGTVLAVMKQSPPLVLRNMELDAYLQQDKQVIMDYGDALAYCAIISSQKTGNRFFVLRIHHVLYDGWSLPKIFQDVQDAYADGIQGSAVGFNHFIKHLQSSERSSSEQFWAEQVSDSPAQSFPVLPSVNYRPFASAEFRHYVPLPNYGSKSHFTLSTKIFAAWSLVFGRYSDMNDVIFGTTFSGRTSSLAGIERIVGPTLATVPFRVSFQHDQNVSDLLRAIQRHSSDVMPHAHIGIQNIRALNADGRRACDFQVLLNIQSSNEPGAKTILGLRELSADLANFHTYAVNLLFNTYPEGMEIHVQFDPQVVDSTQIERITKQVEHVILQLHDESGIGKVGDISLTSPADMQHLEQWNRGLPPAVKACVHQLIEERGRLHPDKEAVVGWDGRFTYEQLDKQAHKLAHHLVGLGIKPDDMVPVCFEKSVWTIVAILGVLKAGAAFVSMDPSHPVNRLEAIVNDVGATIVLSSDKTRSIFSESIQAKIGVVDAKTMAMLPEADRVLETGVMPCNAAYVIFTSGSTGNPKGAIIEHEAYSSSAVECARELHIHGESRVLQFASYSFDVSIQEILATLIVGGCICVPDEIDRLNDISRLINELRVTWMNPTPSFARMISAESIPNVETMVLGGEAPRRDDIDYWAARLRLVNAYGLSECSVTNVINVGLSVGAESRNIGRAVACATWVVDADNHERLAPLGSVGELLIEGHVLAREYLNNPEKTAAVFVQAPGWLRRFRPEATRVYKTGDLVRYTADGTIYYIGRKDSQVKLHGQRFELGEIEHHLRVCLPRTEVAAEIITPVGRSVPMLVGFVVVGGEGDSTSPGEQVAYSAAGRERLSLLTTGLSSRLAQSLPLYMIPSLFIPLYGMPLSVAGKTDRNRLRRIVSEMSVEQISSFASATEGIRQPSTLAETTVRDLWADNLGLDPDSIGLDDNYFQLGGDSISAMLLVATSQAEGVQLTVATVFQNPVLSELALCVQLTDQHQPGIADMLPFEAVPNVEDVGALVDEVVNRYGYSKSAIEDIYPCTPLQDGLVAISIKEPGTYLAQAALSLPDLLDVDRYREAWDTAVRNMPILRTRIVDTSSGLMQLVLDSSVEWQVGNSLQAYLESDREKAMQLGDPLIRFAIVNEPDKRYFCWTAHHALIDGWTAQLIQDNVKRAYIGTGLKPTLGFNHFIKHIGQVNSAEAEEFWKRELADSPLPSFPELPSDNHHPVTDAGLTHTVKFSKRADADIPVSAVIKGAWALVLSKYSDSADVVFGHTTNGRAAPMLGVDRLAGPTIATVPLRVRFDRGWQVGDLFREIQRLSVSAIPFEQTGLQNIRRMGAGAHAACQFQNMLVIQNAVDSGTDAGSECISCSDDTDQAVLQGLEPVEVVQTRFHAHALVVECGMTSDGASIKVEFDSTVISQTQMHRIVRQFSHVIKQFSECSLEASLGDVEMLSPEDQLEISSWNAEIPETLDTCFHHLLDGRMEEYAHAPALVSTTERLSYRELAQASNGLAHRLIELGVGPEMFVPLCFEKSVWAVVAMLAVMKAGAAWVSLDPSHPQSRHKYILETTSARIALSSATHVAAMRHLGLDVTVVDADTCMLLLQDPSPNLSSPETSVSPSNAAYAVLTSGSTGLPKTIVVEHSALSTVSAALGAAMLLDKSSRVLQFAAYTFDISLGDIFPTLLRGGCVCVPTEHERLNGLANTIKSLEATHIQLTPSVAARLEPVDVGQLRVMTIGGEAATKAVLNQWAEHTHLINMYGPAECTIWCAGQPNLQRLGDPARIGRGVGAVTWVVDRDDHTKLAPIGTVGELVIEGPGVARGYLKDETRTNASFINNPKWTLPLGTIRLPPRFYKTGDLVKYMADGTLKFIGRKDTQVKLRGQRIELGEVEFQLKNCFTSPVDLAVEVVTPADSRDSALLAAFIVMGDKDRAAADANAGADAEIIANSEVSRNKLKETVGEIEAKLLDVLPGYMIPSAYIPVTRLPLSTSAKLDRKYLRDSASKLNKEQLFAFMATGNERVAPSTEAEVQLQKLWHKVLGVDMDKIGAGDSFFRLGGDSLDAMRLSSLAQTSGFQLTVGNIIKYPVLAVLAERMGAVGPDAADEMEPFSLLSESQGLDMIMKDAVEQCGVDRNEIEDVYPCTPLQVEFFKNSLAHPGYFSIQFVYSLPDDMDLERLSRAWNIVAASHAIFRTQVIVSSSCFFQVVTKSPGPCTDAQNLESYLSQDAKKPLGLGQQLTRSAIVSRDASGKRYWVWTTHHATYDGWSRQLLLSELQRAYRDTTPSVGRVQFNKYVRYVTQGDCSDADSFWHTQLAGSASKPFGRWPASYQPAANSTLRHNIIVNAEKTSLDFTVATILQAAWAVTVANYTHSNEVTLKLTLTGRNAPIAGIEQMMAPTATMVPHRLRVGEAQHTRSFLRDTQNWWAEVSQFEHLGWDRIRGLSSDAATACDAAMPMVIHPQASSNSNLAGLQFHSARLFRPAPCQFLMDCYLDDAGVAVSVYFDDAVFGAGDMQQLLAQFDSVFHQMCRAGPEHRLQDIVVGEL
ncbi:hypothetical protein TGAM01_v206540 [Trichoderma gamsii]|uniref:Carrier domain-containing protein n=1 Tax=Trichoderma gamsii TaxID=398673 RepID=A0A2P4ZJY3_9HYPO|nr:hypothetical protein TGAM01_v206540 [Trichoderma gamsii]PON24610.1 hypothetical protein TGAM01_v206540 [Trichoderma gamsii]